MVIIAVVVVVVVVVKVMINNSSTKMDSDKDDGPMFCSTEKNNHGVLCEVGPSPKVGSYTYIYT